MTLLETLSAISTNRLKLVVVTGIGNGLLEAFAEINTIGVPVLDLGKSLANELDGKADIRHIDIDAQEALDKLVKQNAVSIPDINYNAICLCNIGFLFEPGLGIDETQFIKDLSKQYCVIILWENDIDAFGKLCWKNNHNKYQLNLTDTDYNLIKLNHEI